MKRAIKWIVGIVCVILVAISVFLFRDKPNIMYFVIIVIVLSMILPYIVVIAISNEKKKEKETRFLEFVRDLVENVKSGTPINKAIFNLRNREYGGLSGHISKLANQLELGLPLTTGLMNFARDSNSKVISRAVNLISEAEKTGGEIESVLEAVANSVNQIEQLKKEQRSAVYSLIVQGYIIFLVFILIVLVLQYYLLPMTEGIARIDDLNVGVSINQKQDLGQPLLALLLVQSFFAGVVIGKISEGNFKEGIKHSFILISITLIVSFGARALFG